MRVWFFKAHSDDYQHQTEQQGYEPHFIPVLDQQYTTEELTQLLQQGPTSISGIIITSQRSVTTLSQAAPQLDEQQCQAWQGLPLYIVGDTTTRKLRAGLEGQLFFLPHEPSPPMVTTDHAAALADHLVQQPPTHLLFLAGDKRRNELPNRLVQGGYRLTEIQTYQTCRHPDLPRRLSALQQQEQDWSVFFSPSGVDYFLSLQPTCRSKIAAIGNTTASHLQQLGYHVHAIASKPDITHLLNAMVDYDQNVN
ncbi:tetrapyrrole biosynthesis, uroporphyrinogen III synthase [Chlamydoabsidia padenii]|nr:tetrapyrrole biosynthesis, uroporphyrinogen III synthase [Chlamydoabsidia padenii]